MIVLDEPYVSEPLVSWLESSQHPVLDNNFTRKATAGRALHLVSPKEAVQRIDAGERVYTNSENALAWIMDTTHNETLSHAISLFKNKAAMRQVLASLDPDLFFKTCSVDELFELDFSQLVTPFVVKPAVGFCSMGVYVVQNHSDWERALADIRQNASTWQALYPESVIGLESFILEGYLTGTEYALDAYFDETGASHILNVLQHDFASPEDTSDRMYVTSAAIVRDTAALFSEWLDRVNAFVGARNFPVHVEVRVASGHVSPIEFNPLRFAGLGGTDVSWYGYGYRTYEAFLNDVQPDFDHVFQGKDDKVYTMSLLNPPADVTGNECFDYEACAARFSHVLELRPFDVARVGNYGFLFLETDAASAGELDFLLHSDLREFLYSAGETRGRLTT